MQYMKARKLATGMLVATLLLSSLVLLLPSVTVSAAVAPNAQISFNVFDSAANPVNGAVATITEVHTSKQYTATSSAGLVTFPGTGTNAVLPGYYLLTVSKTGVYSNIEYPQIVKFTGTGPVLLNPVTLPVATGIISFTITQSVGSGNAANVVVKLYDVNSVSKLPITLPTFTGTSSVNVFPGTYNLTITAPGLVQQTATVTVAASTTIPVTQALSPAYSITGVVYRDNIPATGVSAYLVNTNTALSVDQRIVYARTFGANVFIFDAYAGSFQMIVDAANAQANMTPIIVTSSIMTPITVNVTTASGQSDVSNVSSPAAIGIPLT